MLPTLANPQLSILSTKLSSSTRSLVALRPTAETCCPSWTAGAMSIPDAPPPPKCPPRPPVSISWHYIVPSPNFLISPAQHSVCLLGAFPECSVPGPSARRRAPGRADAQVLERHQPPAPRLRVHPDGAHAVRGGSQPGGEAGRGSGASGGRSVAAAAAAAEQQQEVGGGGKGGKGEGRSGGDREGGGGGVEASAERRRPGGDGGAAAATPRCLRCRRWRSCCWWCCRCAGRSAAAAAAAVMATKRRRGRGR